MPKVAEEVYPSGAQVAEIGEDGLGMLLGVDQEKDIDEQLSTCAYLAQVKASSKML